VTAWSLGVYCTIWGFRREGSDPFRESALTSERSTKPHTAVVGLGRLPPHYAECRMDCSSAPAALYYAVLRVSVADERFVRRTTSVALIAVGGLVLLAGIRMAITSDAELWWAPVIVGGCIVVVGIVLIRVGWSIVRNA
jgi:hypothetical protein